MQQRLPSLIDAPVAFAHRGARAHSRENTLDAFALALRLGANGIETDAWICSDGIVVLDHDGVMRRRGRKVPLSSVPARDRPGHIPTLDQLFEACGTCHHLSIDVKDPGGVDAVVACARRNHFPLDRLWLCHDDIDVVEQWAKLDLGARLVDSSRLQRMKEGPERRIARLAEMGVSVLNMHQSDWSGGLAALAHRFGIYAFGWDAQHDHRLTEMFRMGLDAVYSDHVDRLVAAYQSEIGGLPPLPPAT